MTREVHRFRLSCMMFGQYLIVGSWAVTLATYLMSSPLKGGLHFPAAYAGGVYSTMAIAGIIAPISFGLLADRLFAAQKLLGVLHLIGAVLLGAAGYWCESQQPRINASYRAIAGIEAVDGIAILEWETRLDSITPEVRRALKEAFARVERSPALRESLNDAFYPLFALMFCYAFCSVTTLTLTNVVAFRNLSDPRRSYGNVRLVGTIGWIVAGLSLELFWNPISPDPLYFAAGLSLVMGLGCFALPNTPPARTSKTLGEALGLPAFSMFRERSFSVLIACTLAIGVVQQFYAIYANRFLNELHSPYPAAVQTLAQVSEVGCMALLPLMLYRFGLKTTMILGLIGFILRNAMFATASLPVVAFIGLPMQGIAYTFFVIVASMDVDRNAPSHLRASAQGIFTFVSMGAGTLLGNWLSGVVVQSQTIGDVVAWQTVWLIPTVMSAVVTLACLILFREPAAQPVRSDVDSG